MGYLGRDRLREGKVRISERERGQAEMIKKKNKTQKICMQPHLTHLLIHV